MSTQQPTKTPTICELTGLPVSPPQQEWWLVNNEHRAVKTTFELSVARAWAKWYPTHTVVQIHGELVKL